MTMRPDYQALKLFPGCEHWMIWKNGIIVYTFIWFIVSLRKS